MYNPRCVPTDHGGMTSPLCPVQIKTWAGGVWSRAVNEPSRSFTVSSDGPNQSLLLMKAPARFHNNPFYHNKPRRPMNPINQFILIAFKKEEALVGVFSGHCEIRECSLTALVWRCAEWAGCHYPARLWTLTIASHSSSEWRECGLIIDGLWIQVKLITWILDHDRLFIGRRHSREHWLYRVKYSGKCRFSQDCGS